MIAVMFTEQEGKKAARENWEITISRGNIYNTIIDWTGLRRYQDRPRTY